MVPPFFISYMKEKLREVYFNLNEQNLSHGDLGYEDSDGIIEDRHGYFHCWGNVEVYDFEERKFNLRIMAIIEESNTGQIFEVSPKCVRFVVPIDSIQ